jgi:M6 family metalloprotease-like protein
MLTHRGWRSLLSAMACLGGLMVGSITRAQTPADFGYARLDGDRRPLLVLLNEYSGYPALRAGSAAYFDKFVYGIVGDPIHHVVELNGYFLINSGSKFIWTRTTEAPLGPYALASEDAPDDSARVRLALEAAANDFDFAAYDDNGDGYVNWDELAVLVIDNRTRPTGIADDAATRSTPCFQPRPGAPTLCLQAALLGDNASAMSFAHELLHQLETVDMYGWVDINANLGFTPMGASIFSTVDDRRSWELDPYHKVALGWVEPQISSLAIPGRATLGEAGRVGGDAPLILPRRAGDVHEYFMMEFRKRPSVGDNHYDADLPSEGLVIWRVRTDSNHVPLVEPTGFQVWTVGAPDLVNGQGTAWPVPGVGQPPLTAAEGLKWHDGSSTHAHFSVRRMDEHSIEVSWQLDAEQPPTGEPDPDPEPPCRPRCTGGCGGGSDGCGGECPTLCGETETCCHGRSCCSGDAICQPGGICGPLSP